MSLAAVPLSPLALSEVLLLNSFDANPATVHTFKELNDPVMGGKSVGTWSVNATGQFGVLNGEVNDVPSLKAPGFIKAAADGKYPDASALLSGDLVLTVRSTTPTYKGFRVTVAAGTVSPDYSCAGGGGLPLSGGCYKAKFSVPAGEAFTQIKIPFNTFSDHWSSATGDQTKTCADDKTVCITAEKLAKIQRVELWAEGALGMVHLEVKSVAAASASTVAVVAAAPTNGRPAAKFDTCKGGVQSPLRFGISGRNDTQGIPVAVDANESLAEAVCCDSRVALYAEPQFLYSAPDINMFSKVDATGVTTFYDSVCGLPIFKAPIGRTFAAWEADTKDHGWPSFRDGEVILDNVVTDKTTGRVTSKCGTHLGSFLPDAKGSRWCIDLSCISGNKN
jgi:hypothetical protein